MPRTENVLNFIPLDAKVALARIMNVSVLQKSPTSIDACEQERVPVIGRRPRKGLLYTVLMASIPANQGARSTAAEAADKLVLATVNAPYKRTISAKKLAACLAKAEPGPWSVHLATFFTDVSPTAILAFASAHAVSKSELAHAYFVVKSRTGEGSSDLEAELGSLAKVAS